jgi:hypothetical protein
MDRSSGRFVLGTARHGAGALVQREMTPQLPQKISDRNPLQCHDRAAL